MRSTLPAGIRPGSLAQAFQHQRNAPFLRSHLLASSWTPQSAIRCRATYADDQRTGHIVAGENEGILFFDNVFPLKLQTLTALPVTAVLDRIKSPSLAGADPQEILQKALPDDTSLRINKVIPRLKDGGAFITFTHGVETNTKEVESKVREYLEKKSVRPWWNPLATVKTSLVRGRPWIEDLYRPPSCRVKVEFVPEEEGGSEAVELSQEHLYSMFRPYGKLLDIESQPADSKVVPKYAHLNFQGTKAAIMAKNCLHGFRVFDESGTKMLARLKLSYDARKSTSWIREWISSHPRIMVPLMAALATAITIAVFDPIRTFFIKTHITRTFHVEDNKLYQWFATRATDLLKFRRNRDDNAGWKAIKADRKDMIDQLQAWLMESADTFIVVQGPRGSGKRDLVMEQALEDRKYKLTIDCKPIQEARSDSAIIDATAKEVGYRPVFSWMNSISGLIDMAAQGATGLKPGFSETVDTQLDKILTNTATALREISLEDRKRTERDKAMSEDEYLEAHPERRPVIVIDNFLHKSQESDIIYDKLAEWGARITTANIAHVIFLTTDVSFNKSLSKALPDRAFRQISLGDFQPAVAKRFVVSALDYDDNPDDNDPSLLSEKRTDLHELDECIELLGGRLTDLEFLSRRIKAGETPKKAVREIVDQSASEILKMYVLGPVADEEHKDRWTPEQAWTLIKDLANNKVLRYNEVILSNAFAGAKNPDSVLQTLEQAELISIASSNGRPYGIKPGKPVYRSAFKLLAEDRVLRSRLDSVIVATQIKDANAAIDKCETELKLIGELPKSPPEVGDRVRYLLSKLMTNQQKVESLEKEAAELKKVLMTEY